MTATQMWDFKKKKKKKERKKDEDEKVKGGESAGSLLLWRSSGKECLQPPVHTISSVHPRGTSNKAVLSGIRSSLWLWLQVE